MESARRTFGCRSSPSSSSTRPSTLAGISSLLDKQAISKSWQCHKRFDHIPVELSLVSFLNNQTLAFTIHEPQFRREEKGGKAEQQEEDDEGDVRSSKDRSYASLGSPSVSGSGQVGNRHELFVIKHLLCSSIKIFRSARIKRLAALRRRLKRVALKARSSLRST